MTPFVRSLIKSTIPPYFMIALMVITSFLLYPRLSPTSQSSPMVQYDFVFLLLALIVSEVWVSSKVFDRWNWQETRVSLPSHWRRSILDVTSWCRRHDLLATGALMIMIFSVMGIGEGVIYGLQLIHADWILSLLVGLGALFGVFFLMSIGQVVYRSSVAPIGELSDEEVKILVNSLPTFSQKSIEFMKRSQIFVPSERAKKVSEILLGIAFVGIGISWAAANFGNNTLMEVGAFACAGAMLPALILLGFPITGKKISVLSMALSDDEVESD